jgi:hypothetical protein
LPAEGFLTPTGITITKAAVAVTADIEHRTEARKAENPLTKNGGSIRRHRFPEAGMNKERRSWQNDLPYWEVLDRGYQ